MKVKFILDVGKLLHMPLLIVFNYFLTEDFQEALSIGVVQALFKTLKRAMLPYLTTTRG
jgi:hypothetical protein